MREAEVAVLTAVRAGDVARVKQLLCAPQLPQGWLLKNGTAAIALAQGHGHYTLMEVLRDHMVVSC